MADLAEWCIDKGLCSFRLHRIETHGLSEDGTESLVHLDLAHWVLTLLGRDWGHPYGRLGRWNAIR
jgi:hypothetical protein